jgi:hypothetical protein
MRGLSGISGSISALTAGTTRLLQGQRCGQWCGLRIGFLAADHGTAGASIALGSEMASANAGSWGIGTLILGGAAGRTGGGGGTITGGTITGGLGGAAGSGAVRLGLKSFNLTLGPCLTVKNCPSSTRYTVNNNCRWQQFCGRNQILTLAQTPATTN